MKGRKWQRYLIMSSQLAFIHFSHVTFLSSILSLVTACGLRNAGLTQTPVCSLPSCSPSRSEKDLFTWSLPIKAFNIWSDSSTALLFDGVIWVLFLFVSVFSFLCFDVISFKAAKQILLGFFIYIYFLIPVKVYFALSFVCCLCTLCLCAYNCFFSSDLSKAWPGGNCPYQLIDYWSSWNPSTPLPTPPHTWNTGRSSCRPFLIKLCALHPKMLGIWLWLPPFILSFLLEEKKTIPIFGCWGK